MTCLPGCLSVLSEVSNAEMIQEDLAGTVPRQNHVGPSGIYRENGRNRKPLIGRWTCSTTPTTRPMPTISLIGLSGIVVWLLTVRSTTHGFSTPTNTNKNPKTQPSLILERFDQILTKLQKPETQLKDHIYLQGNYAPVQEEHTMVPVTKVVAGKIPTDVNGMLCRNGPNPVTHRPTRKRYHWFDGHAMLHNLQFQNGKVHYTNQFVPSIRYQVEEELQDEYFPTLGEYDGAIGLIKILFHPSMVRRRVPDLTTVLPPNTSVLMFDHKFYCLNEGALPLECRLKPDGTLEYVGYETFGGLLDYPVSAHPRVHNNELLFHSYTTNNELIQRDGPIKVGRYSPQHNKLHFYFAPTQESYVSFAHGMLHTENYMIVWDCNVHFDPKAMFDGGSYFRSKKEYNLRFALVPMSAQGRDDVVWFDTGESAAIVHPLNAWEEGDEVVIWTPRCTDLQVDLESEGINRFEMVEYRLNLRTGKSKMTTIDNSINVEFSVIPIMGSFTRYGYTAIQDVATPGEGSFSGFCIWDMQEKSYRATYYDKNEVGGEPVVITGDTGKVYVGTFTFSMSTNESYFVLYDGVTAELVCKLQIPHRVPFGFHGQWISADELQSHFQHHGMS